MGKAALLKQQAALLELGRRWSEIESDFDRALASVVETATDALDIDHASVWLFENGRQRLVRRADHDRVPVALANTATLEAADHPAYFAALTSGEVVAVSDLVTDPRTRSLVSVRNDDAARAMLDAPVRFGGEAVGVLCAAGKGPREFTTDDQNTAVYLANLVSLAFEVRYRISADREKAKLLALLRGALEASGAALLAVSNDDAALAHNQRLLEIFDMPAALAGPAGDHGPRAELMIQSTVDPDAERARVASIEANGAPDDRYIMELKDGRSLECASQPLEIEGKIFGIVWSFRDITYLRRIEFELRELAIRDALTGLFNRRRAEELLEIETKRVQRSGHPMSVALVDIDHFKRINDVHGHGTGDKVLQAVAADFRKRLRGIDRVCRWGGEEFLLILPDTNVDNARKLLEQLLGYVGRERGGLPQITFSAGVAAYDGTGTAHELINAADERLYRAKETRNRVC